MISACGEVSRPESREQCRVEALAEILPVLLDRYGVEADFDCEAEVGAAAELAAERSGKRNG